VVLTTDAAYSSARQIYVTTFQDLPQIIVYCETFGDASICLDFAREFGLPATCRAGGHSTAGYSMNTGMVIDVGRIDYVVVDPAARRVRIGAGARFGKVDAVLDLYRLHVPGGGCPDVGVAGYVQAGGYGFTSLLYGMNCDNLVEAIVALADGNLVVADAATNADLFWALKGGTGNNFGVLLEVTYALHELDMLWGFGLAWDLSQAADALSVLRELYTGAKVPPNLGYQCLLVTVSGARKLLMRGMYRGSAEEAKSVLRPLMTTPGATLDVDRYGRYADLNQYLLSYPVELPPVPDYAPGLADSRYLRADAGDQCWRDIVAYFDQTPVDGNFVGLEPYGGRIMSVGKTESALIHRDASFDVSLWSFWMDEEQKSQAIPYLEGFIHLLDRHTNGEAYQGYPRRRTGDYRRLYWGACFPTLLKIKQKYDPPPAFFKYEQDVSPGPAVPGPAAPEPTALRDAIRAPIDYPAWLRRPAPFTRVPSGEESGG